MGRAKREKSTPRELSGATPKTAQTSATDELPVDPELQAWLADLGELAGPLAHGFSNFLNVVLLQVAMLEQEGPEDLRADLAEIRRQGMAVDAWIKHFQEYRRGPRSALLPIDLNQAVKLAAAAWKGPGIAAPAQVSLSLELAPRLPPIRGYSADVRRLVRWLLVHAAGAAGPGGTITVRTKATSPVTLSIADSGPAPPPELLGQMFEQMTPVRAGTSALELAACRSLVRRLEGTIHAAREADGSMVIVVELAAADDKVSAGSLAGKP